MPTIGVAIITKNAQAHLAACLQSLTWCDQVVILDSGSTDQTLNIAQSHGAQIHQSIDWPGFGIQKNRAIALLETDWIFALDADEIVNAQLADSIQAAVQNPQSEVYQLNRLSNYCGRWMRHTGWHPDYLPRLFKKGSARYSEDLVHERLIFSSSVSQLDGLLLHYSFDDLESVLDKINRYSSAGAQQRLNKGSRSSLSSAIFKGVWTFIRSYIIKRGFLDGREGFILSVSNAEGAYYRQLKLMYLQEKV
ncbi:MULTISPECIES: glycosyltransferase family 2 protein [Deefgea]|uniref:Glycosyltransferase n=1 Tax=Deefgea chitinilytica TaxID=570276 RepID=A0ABS2CDF2_9NEIS|nr:MULTISPECIES: glycosyltransferase family 2 protein [Deefgea]MBM5572173.1 glycosyltransferase [Deefgea chitinilytica]MBM9889408.1 glycosyltransferase family 2 protein [Deefgea sp. CFH1-16]